MLQKICLECQIEGELKASYQWGTIMHGVLMESLPPEVADYMHQKQLRPFSQYVQPKGDRVFTWHIGLWDEEVAMHIIKAVMSMTYINMKHKGVILTVQASSRNCLSENDYFKRFFGKPDPCRRYEIIYLTPSTHKQDGRYALFPSPELIVNSLFMRYNTFNKKYSIDDPEAITHVMQHLHLVRYSLRTAVFYLEKTKITGYLGKITLVITGPDSLARLAGALISFGEYSGIGIKTALGMGAVAIKELSN
ncbi:MAG: CRISPR-associated endoribonuclease Cas6 [Syntrophomonadaceae bacterium]|jgi:CRISPR-associated endoribonuclease Cas6